MLVSSSVEKLSLQMESEGEKEVMEAGWRWWGAGQGEEYEEELGREWGREWGARKSQPPPHTFPHHLRVMLGPQGAPPARTQT